MCISLPWKKRTFTAWKPRDRSLTHTHTSMLLLWIKFNSIRTQPYVLFERLVLIWIEHWVRSWGRRSAEAVLVRVTAYFDMLLHDSDNVTVYEWTNADSLLHTKSSDELHYVACIDQPTSLNVGQINAISLQLHLPSGFNLFAVISATQSLDADILVWFFLWRSSNPVSRLQMRSVLPMAYCYKLPVFWIWSKKTIITMPLSHMRSV